MKITTRTVLIGLVLVTGMLTLACPERTSIADIEANPSKFNNKKAAIAGTVKDGYGVNIPFTSIRGGAYKIDDGTGSLWVITQKSVPSKGTQIGVKGKIQNGVNFGGKNYGLAMMEDDRRLKKK